MFGSTDPSGPCISVLCPVLELSAAPLYLSLFIKCKLAFSSSAPKLFLLYHMRDVPGLLEQPTLLVSVLRTSSVEEEICF